MGFSSTAGDENKVSAQRRALSNREAEFVMKLISLIGGSAAMGVAIVLCEAPMSIFASYAAGILVMFSLGLVGYGYWVTDCAAAASAKDESASSIHVGD